MKCGVAGQKNHPQKDHLQKDHLQQEFVQKDRRCHQHFQHNHHYTPRGGLPYLLTRVIPVLIQHLLCWRLLPVQKLQLRLDLQHLQFQLQDRLHLHHLLPHLLQWRLPLLPHHLLCRRLPPVHKLQLSLDLHHLQFHLQDRLHLHHLLPHLLQWRLPLLPQHLLCWRLPPVHDLQLRLDLQDLHHLQFHIQDRFHLHPLHRKHRSRVRESKQTPP